MCISFLLIVAAISTVEGVNRARLIQTPLPVNGFDLNRYLGEWYTQAFYAPCSWSGAKDFTDYVTNYQFGHNGVLTIEITWRALRCVNTINDYIPKSVPGIFLLKDTFGDAITSESYVVATDYNRFVVKWGCPRRLAEGFCQDPYVIVKTRRRHPSLETMHIIRKVLFDMFEMTLNEMTLYGNNTPCPRPRSGQDYGLAYRNPVSIPFSPIGKF